jgi:tetratricopeptide (TPR) repeat protein
LVRRFFVPALLGIAASLLGVPHGGAQELVPRVELPPPPPGACELVGASIAASRSVPEEDREGARSLLAEANQASILGDDARARTLLRGAAALDPSSSEIAYRLGRLLETSGQGEEAVAEFCRYLALEPEGPDAPDVRARVDALAPPEPDPLPAAARAAFQQGVSALDRSAPEEAAQLFSRALVEHPDWPDAHFNRGIAYLRAGRTGAGRADLERFLELEPGAPEVGAVAGRLEALLPSTGPVRSPGMALATGLILPGMGHVYAGRPGTGLAILAGAGGAAAAGLLYTQVEVSCLVPPVDGQCPAGQVAERVEERPLLGPGLAVAGLVTVAGAIHAFLQARGTPDRVADARSPAGWPATGPALGLAEGHGWALFVEMELPGLRNLQTGAEGLGAAFRIRF